MREDFVTQAEYNALGPNVNPNVLYRIIEESDITDTKRMRYPLRLTFELERLVGDLIDLAELSERNGEADVLPLYNGKLASWNIVVRD